MTDKVFNHEVTAGLLRGWLSDGPKGRQGIWYWDLKRGERKPTFEEGKRAKFAGHNFLYVGDDGGVPISTDLEDRLGKHEYYLVSLCARLWEGTATQAHLDKLAAQALPAIVTAAFRSKWSAGGVSEWLELDEPGRLAYLADQFRSTILSFRGWDFLFYQKSDVPLLIGDAPFFDFRVTGVPLAEQDGGVCAMPLGKHAVMFGFKSQRAIRAVAADEVRFGEPVDPALLSMTMRLLPGPLSPSLASNLNQFTLERARTWVVAGTEQELLARTDLLQPEALQKRVETDTVVVQGAGGKLLHRFDLKPAPDQGPA